MIDKAKGYRSYILKVSFSLLSINLANLPGPYFLYIRII